jgi:DEAD/DEAH box helicase domain-containing protein
MDTAQFNPTIYLYDSHAGGIGLAEHLFDILPDLLHRGLETLETCACRDGCPSRVGPVAKSAAGPRERRRRPCAR